jgi:hypothetical protein
MTLSECQGLPGAGRPVWKRTVASNKIQLARLSSLSRVALKALIDLIKTNIAIRNN